MDRLSGIELHSNNSVVVISDEVDRILYQRRLPNDLKQTQAALAPFREDLVSLDCYLELNSGQSSDRALV